MIPSSFPHDLQVHPAGLCTAVFHSVNRPDLPPQVQASGCSSGAALSSVVALGHMWLVWTEIYYNWKYRISNTL